MQKSPKTRIVHGEHYADILVRYSEDSPPIYYWICQKFGLAEIFGLGTATSFEQAEQEARECLKLLTEGLPCEVEPLDLPKYRLS
jgi:hypothetical protein